MPNISETMERELVRSHESRLAQLQTEHAAELTKARFYSDIIEIERKYSALMHAELFRHCDARAAIQLCLN